LAAWAFKAGGIQFRRLQRQSQPLRNRFHCPSRSKILHRRAAQSSDAMARQMRSPAFLLGSEQIRGPAPYNAILAAIAAGETKFNGIQQLIGVERGALSCSLRTLLELGWIRREFPFGETSERRALYRVADPFLTFWYRFVAPIASALQFSDPTSVYAAQVAPRLSEYMGWSVFEEICGQWLQRNAKQRLGLTVRQMARYWSRDGRTEVDLVAELDDGTFLFGECKWRPESVTRLNDLSVLQAKVASLPEARWRNRPKYILFALGGFSPELQQLAADPAERLYLATVIDMFKPDVQ
jgi:hypothetical protein